MCFNAEIREPVELKFEWVQDNKNKFVAQIKNTGKPVLAVLIYRAPMGRQDGFAEELLPKPKLMDKMISVLKEKYTIVQVGSGDALHNYRGVDFNFSNKTSVSEMFDILSFADAVFGYCSFLVPFCESTNKKALFCWAEKGLVSQTAYINRITPRKILQGDNSSYVVDSNQWEAIEKTLNDFMR